MTSANKSTSVVELNVGGVHYTTTVSTLTRHPDSKLYRIFRRFTSRASKEEGKATSSKTRQLHDGRVFIDRDGLLFRFILDYLRNERNELILPEAFNEVDRLIQEAEYFQLKELVKYLQSVRHSESNSINSINNIKSILSKSSTNTKCVRNSILPLGKLSPRTIDIGQERREPFSTITVSYRGTLAFGRGDVAGSDPKFRKLYRILVAGRVSNCREVFRETLNESRDPDRGDGDRFTSRFFLKHSFLEQAFDMLLEAGYRMIGVTASGTSGTLGMSSISSGMDTSELRWLHYNEYIFSRP